MILLSLIFIISLDANNLISYSDLKFQLLQYYRSNLNDFKFLNFSSPILNSSPSFAMIAGRLEIYQS